jgi:hypothetical protein
MHLLRPSSLIFGGLLIAATATPAAAYIRTKTCDPAGLNGPYCAPEQIPVPVRWRDPCVTYLVNARGSDDFAPPAGQLRPQLNETLRRAILGAAEAWNRETCGALTLTFGGITCSDEVSLTPTQLRARNINLLIFQEEEWEYPSSAIALTTLSANPTSGEILDADIEFNGVDYTFEEITQPGSTNMDVRNTLTHEFGHVIGFAHEPDLPSSTMYPDAQPGETSKRALSDNDVEGLCEVYPLNESTPLCQANLPEDDTCAIIMEGVTACATAQQAAPPATPALWSLLALIAMLAAPRGAARRAQSIR